MRYFLGFIALAAAAGFTKAALDVPDHKSIGKIILAVPLAFVSYIFLRPLIFKPLEMMGLAVFLPAPVINHNNRKFKEVNEHIKNGKLKLALEALDAILKKKPNWIDAQVKKIQLLGTNIYDIERAQAYGETVLLNGRFNRNKMHLLIVLTAMMRSQGYQNDANNLSMQCRTRAPKSLKKLIDKMEESWQRGGRF